MIHSKPDIKMATRVIWFISLSDLAYIWVGISYTYKCSVPVTLIIFENPFSKPELWYHVRLLLSLFLKPWGIGRRAYHDHTLYCNTRNILGGGCTWSYIICQHKEQIAFSTRFYLFFISAVLFGLWNFDLVVFWEIYPNRLYEWISI